MSLTALGGLLTALDVYREVDLETLGPQVVSTLPFLCGVGHFVRRGAWLAACGSAGFSATAIAMIDSNSNGGWAGFFSARCR